MARRKAKVYEKPAEGLREWLSRYKKGVETGAEKYKAMIDTMVNNYASWINFVYNDLVKVAEEVAKTPKEADPGTNYLRRGAPFARLFKSKAAQYRLHKIAVAASSITVAQAPTLTPTTPPRIIELASTVS